MKPEATGNTRKFRWSVAKEEAAALLALAELTDIEVAAKVGTSDRTLRSWKAHPEFAARVVELVREMGEPALRHGIALRNRRLKEMNFRWNLLQKVISDRAADTRMEGIPGGPTGLLVIEEAETVTLKNADGSERAEVVPVKVAVDTAMLKEMRELEKQAAQEVGQWVNKIAPTNPDGTDEFHAGVFADDEVAAILERLAARLGLAAAGQVGPEPEEPAGLLPP
jgi:hypothetical protein